MEPVRGNPDCDRLEPGALVSALKAGRIYATQGPSLRRLRLEGDRLLVATSGVATIALTSGGDRWQRGTEQRAEPGMSITEAAFDVAPFRGAYCRVVAIDGSGRRAWSNPIWPERPP